MGVSDLLVMAVTRLGKGVCVACLDEENRWIRPTRADRHGFRSLDVDDLRGWDGGIQVEVGNVLQWRLARPIPRDTHTEDFLVGLERPLFVRKLSHSELLSRCEQACEWKLTSFLRSEDRSIILFRPQQLVGFRFGLDDEGAYQARITFTHGTYQDDYSVTDIVWRTLGWELLCRCGRLHITLDPAELQRLAAVRVRYLIVGRGQPWSWKGPLHRYAGKSWPFIIGVVPDRPLEVCVDYDNL